MSEAPPLASLVWTNCLGEQFYADLARLWKVSPETGEEEDTGTLSLAEVQADPYWNARHLQEAWEMCYGAALGDRVLVPVIPFALGGEYEASNLMAMQQNEAAAYYCDLRAVLEKLPDGSRVRLVVGE